MKDILKELEWRNLLYKYTIGLKEQLNIKYNTLYVGFDPTADSLHIGSMLPICILKHFHAFGYETLSIIGGATALIGDPSGKYKERILLDKEILLYNEFCIQKQLNLFLSTKKNKLLNNYDWIGNLFFLNFVRDIGKNMTINYMISKDFIKSRLQLTGDGISFTEFTYQFIQAYDFYYLYNYKNCYIQIGGSDQWGNIITGIELIRKITRGIGKVYGMTFPLLTKSNGIKFGKSDNNENIWLDDKRTHYFKFYNFWLNISDEESKHFIKFYIFLQKKEIDNLFYFHKMTPYKRVLQKTLAKHITAWIHGVKKYNKSIDIANILYRENSLRSILSLSEKTFLDFLKKKSNVSLHRGSLKKGISIIEFLIENTGFFNSKGEAKQSLKEGLISLNREKINDKFIINENNILSMRYILLQKSKKNYFIVEVI